MGATRDASAARTLESLADSALAESRGGRGGGATIERDGQLCMTMMVAGNAVGVLGVTSPSDALTENRRRILMTISALLGIAVKNVQLFTEVRQNSLQDGLTRCFNRTHGLEVLDTELSRARRTSSTLSMVLFDIDHFKAVNDRYGHLCGDAVLAAVGRRIKDVLRASDVKIRYGGEEFMLLLPDTPVSGARRVAESVRVEVSEVQIIWNDGPIRVTASFGVAMAGPGDQDAQALIARADVALYTAKKQGRNRVVVSDESPKPEPLRDRDVPAAREPLPFAPGAPVRRSEAG